MKNPSGCAFGQSRYDTETTLTESRTPSSVLSSALQSARRYFWSVGLGTLAVIARNNDNSDADAEMYVCGQTVAWEYVWLLVGLVVTFTEAEMFHPG